MIISGKVSGHNSGSSILSVAYISFIMGTEHTGLANLPLFRP